MSLAEYLHVSKSYLSTLFKQEAGMTVMEYITCARMKEAKRLLLHTDMRVCEIYEEIGYQSDKYFIAGIFGCMIFQQFWNIAMILGILPITGITLPFLSYGGSSLLSYMIAIGMCFDIHRQTSIAKYNQID